MNGGLDSAKRTGPVAIEFNLHFDIRINKRFQM
jgi:hypothetical protein